MERTKEQWQAFFDDTFPAGCRVLNLGMNSDPEDEDAPEGVYVPRVLVTGIGEEGRPQVWLFPVEAPSDLRLDADVEEYPVGGGRGFMLEAWGGGTVNNRVLLLSTMPPGMEEVLTELRSTGVWAETP